MLRCTDALGETTKMSRRNSRAAETAMDRRPRTSNVQLFHFGEVVSKLRSKSAGWSTFKRRLLSSSGEMFLNFSTSPSKRVGPYRRRSVAELESMEAGRALMQLRIQVG